MSKFNYQGKQVYYEEHGTGPLLIFAHGNTASGHMFDAFMEDFADFHCVILDFMGHGRSERVKQFPLDFWYDQGLQIIELAKQFPNEKAMVIGSSGGAIAVLNAALEAPELFCGVVADSFEGEQTIPGLLNDFRKERADSLRSPESISFYRMMQGDDYETIVNQDTDMMFRHLEQVKHYYHKPLADITLPVLLLGSAQDDMIPGITEIYKQIAEANPNYTSYVFPHGTHPSFYSNGQETIAKIKQFYQDCCHKNI